MIFLYISSKIRNSFKPSLIILTIISIILKQPYHYNYHLNISDKTTLYTWLFMCLVLMSAYSGCMHSLLSIKDAYKIETISELATAQRDYHYNLICFKTRPFTQIFNASNLTNLWIISMDYYGIVMQKGFPYKSHLEKQ